LWVKLTAVAAKEATTKAITKIVVVFLNLIYLLPHLSLQKARCRVNAYTDPTSVFRASFMHSFCDKISESLQFHTK
jgi:hypothetical protein